MVDRRMGSRMREVLLGRGSSRAYLGFVLTGMVMALAAVETLLRVYVVPVDHTRQNRIHLVYTAKSSNAILGDSHSNVGFMNTPNFTNLARAGSSPGALEIVAREYFRFRDPGRVIVEASPQLFTRLMQKQGPQHHDDYFVQNVGLPFALYVFEPGIARHVGSLRNIQDLENLAHLAREQKIVGSQTEHKIQEKRATYSPERLQEVAAVRVKQSLPVRQLRESQVFGAYRRLLQFLRDRGADVCMVRTPVNQPFLEQSADAASYQDGLRALEQSARELGLRYVDFRDLPVKLEEKHFHNPDHLLAEGASIFAPAAVEACFPDG